jgi:hypothetical protein
VSAPPLLLTYWIAAATAAVAAAVVYVYVHAFSMHGCLEVVLGGSSEKPMAAAVE